MLNWDPNKQILTDYRDWLPIIIPICIIIPIIKPICWNDHKITQEVRIDEIYEENFNFVVLQEVAVENVEIW